MRDSFFVHGTLATHFSWQFPETYGADVKICRTPRVSVQTNNPMAYSTSNVYPLLEEIEGNVQRKSTKKPRKKLTMYMPADVQNPQKPT